MREIKNLGFVICLLIMTSCGTSKIIENTVRDGSSFEKAIIAKSVEDEYEYIRKVCSDCKMLGQSLVYNDNKPYDLLRLTKANGDPVAYIFDISNFF